METEQGRLGTKCAELKAQVQAVIRHQLSEGQALLAGGPTTSQDLSLVVTPGGLTPGEKIRALCASLAAKAHSKVCDVAKSLQVSFNKRAETN